MAYEVRDGSMIGERGALARERLRAHAIQTDGQVNFVRRFAEAFGKKS